MNKQVMIDSVGTVNIDELGSLAQVGTGSMNAQSTPLTASSLECVGLSIDAVSAVTSLFSCSKGC